MSLPSSRWPLALSAGAFLAGLTFALWKAGQNTDGRLVYGLDDAYIHMAIAKNLARHGLWGCTPFHFSSSSSSLSWTALLGLTYFVTGVRDVTPLLLNTVVALLTLVVADRYLARWHAAPGLRAIALIGLIIASPLPGLVLLGMEHILHILATIWFAGAAMDALSTEPATETLAARDTAILCVLGALLVTSRYEGLFLVAIVSVAFAVRGRWGAGCVVGAASVLPTVLFGLLAMANGWLFFPNSLMLKAGGENVSIATALFKPIGQVDLQFLAGNNQLFILVLVGVASAVVQWRHRDTPWRPSVLAPLFLTLMILLHGHYAFTSMYWEYRYAAYLTAFGVFATAVLLSDYWNESSVAQRDRAGRVVPLLGMAALLWLVSDVPNGILSSQEIRAAASTYVEHVKAAQFLKRFYPNATVVVNDLGTVTYFTDARIIDMFGLGDIEPATIRRRHGGEYNAPDVYDWIAPHRPSIAILQVGWAWVVPRIPNQWAKVAEVELPVDGQHVGFFAVDHSAALALRTNVEAFYGPLASQGYRLKVFESD